jgi:hypothetical protein
VTDLYSVPAAELEDRFAELERRIAALEALETRREMRAAPAAVVTRDRKIMEYLDGQTVPLPPSVIALAIEDRPDLVANRCRSLERAGEIYRVNGKGTPHYLRSALAQATGGTGAWGHDA